MRYFNEKERQEIEDTMIYFLRTTNDIPSSSNVKTNPVKEFKRHGIDNPKYFKDPIHQKIFKIALAMDEKEIPLSINSFKRYLEENANLGPDISKQIFSRFLLTKIEEYISAIEFEYHVHTFKEHLIMDYWMHVFKMHEDKKWKSLDVLENSFGIIRGFENLWDKFKQQDLHETNESMKDELLEKVKNLQEGISTSIKTDLHEWDEFTGGFEDSELYLIAGRPSMGKTTVAIAFAKRMIYREKRVHFFTLEMTRKQIINKFVADDLGIPYRDIKRGNLTPEQLNEVIELYDLYDNHPYLIVDELQTQNLSEFIDKVRNTKADIRMLDYLQLLNLDEKSGLKATNREQEVGQVSKSLKRLAKEVNNPVIALSQLSRAVESRSNKRPMLSDLRESGSLEQDADVIIFVYRDAYYQMQLGISVDPKIQGNIELIIAKGREIGLGTFEMWLDLTGNKIYEGFRY